MGVTGPDILNLISAAHTKSIKKQTGCIFKSARTDQIVRNTCMATYLEETEVSRGQSAQSDDHLCADGAEVFSSWGGWGEMSAQAAQRPGDGRETEGV